MKVKPIIFLVILSFLSSFLLIGRDSEKIKAIRFNQVQIRDSFWLPRIKTNKDITIPFSFKKCEETDRISNFEKAGGLIKGEFVGRRYNDSDVFKIMEGAAYSLSTHPDKKLEKYMDNLISKIAAAQENDGYLFTARTVNPKNPPPGAGPERWSKLSSSHELYNVGHMYEAAVAYYHATGKKNFLNIALKNANLINKIFGPGKKSAYPGHQEIEIGLVKLYQVTGEKKYLKLGQFFLDERGKNMKEKKYSKESNFSIYNQASYYQAHKPVIEQTEAIGHSVRAVYMYSGMADVARLTGNKDYIKAIKTIWNNVVEKKLYITGGIGARHNGEAFGDSFELPNMTAYNETCAAIANIFWNHRLFIMEGDAKYIDVLERTLYNGFLSGISLSGDRFFYPNPLESDGEYKFNQGELKRKPWFDCSCCPSNIARFLPSISGYIYAQRDSEIFINLFMKSRVKLNLKKNSIKIEQHTNYPWNGNIKVLINPQKEQDFTLKLRIPGWAQNQPVPGNLYSFLQNFDKKPILKINSKPVKYKIIKGYACLNKKWKKGDEIILNLPMPIRKTISHPQVQENVNKVAIQRGPLVYCFEEVDNGKVSLKKLSDTAKFTTEVKNLSGVPITIVKTLGQKPLTAVPYYFWAHRTTGEMAVWLPRKNKMENLSITKSFFNKSKENKNIYIYTLNNKNGLILKITEFGGIVTSLKIPSKKGMIDVVLGYNNLQQYEEEHPYFGALIGRYANRIAKGKFTLDQKKYTLAVNNGANHLHGGIKGFDKVIWSSEKIQNSKEVGVRLSYISRNGEEGYPGKLTVQVDYLLNNKNELVINYRAETDRNTPINLTNHSYFNLNGEGSGDILGHLLTIHADHFTPVDAGLIPTGEIKSVKSSPMDFTKPFRIGARIKEVAGGYDHNFVLNKSDSDLKPAAELTGNISGISMKIFTTEPGIQFYSGNFLDGTQTGKKTKKYLKHFGLCLETQHFPDSPNKPDFPSVILKPGKTYTQKTIYKFSF